VKPIRIARWYWKLLYVVASVVIIYLIALFADPSRSGDGLRGILRALALFILTIVAARIFRGQGEDVAAPRAWWRMTGGWLAGLFITVVLFLVTLGGLGVAFGSAGKLADAGTIQGGGALGIVGGILFLLYLDSTVRLILERRRAGREADAAEQAGSR
jgi:hypothetical protein